MKVRTRIIDKTIDTPTLSYAKDGDAGIDLTATSKWYDEYGNVCYGTNRAFEIPKGYVGLLFPRSSNAKMDLSLSNSVGVLDSGYRGEVLFKFKPTIDFVDFDKTNENCVFANEREEKYGVFSIAEFYNIGDRIGQLIIIPYPSIDFEEVDELSDTERGDGGYGSSGK